MARDRLLRHARRIVKTAIAAVCLIGANQLSSAIYVSNAHGPGLASAYGFRLDTPYLQFGGENGEWTEVTQLNYVSEDGALGNAGFRSGDILADLSPHSFYGELLKAQRNNRAATIHVLRGSPETLLEQFERHELNVTPVRPAIAAKQGVR